MTRFGRKLTGSFEARIIGSGLQTGAGIDVIYPLRTSRNSCWIADILANQPPVDALRLLQKSEARSGRSMIWRTMSTM